MSAALRTPLHAPAPGARAPRGGGRPAGLLLDFGSVISVSVFERHRETERILGLAPGAVSWLGPLEPGSDALWRDMLANKITERDYWRLRARELG